MDNEGREQIKKDLDPHKPARMAMWLWGAQYASSGMGSMRYWDSLSDSAKNTSRRAVAEIIAARPRPQRGAHRLGR